MIQPKSMRGLNRRHYYVGVKRAIDEYENTINVSLKHFTSIPLDIEDDLHWFDYDPDEDVRKLTAKLEATPEQE